MTKKAHTTRLGSEAQLQTAVTTTLNDYLESLGDVEATNIYRLVVDEVERPMLEAIMHYTHGNQSRAALVLGINRATLRTKLKRHNLI